MPFEEQELWALLDSASELPDEVPLTDNIFAILKMENKEVSTHSAFFAYLFSNRSFLKSFIEDVLGKEAEADNFGFDRELVFDNGRIDFVFWIDDKPIAMEMKVWAGEQDQQIERYRKYVVNHGGDESDVYFLTPIERTATSGTNPHNITFRDNIYPWLRRIKDTVDGDTKVLIRQYSDLVAKLSGGVEMDNDRKLNIITGKKDFVSIDKLMDARRVFLAKAMHVFFNYLRDKLENILNQHNVKVSYCPSEYERKAIENYYDQSYYPQLFYKVMLSSEQRARLKLSEDEDICFAIEVSKNAYYGFTVRRTVETETEFVADSTKFYDLCEHCSSCMKAMTTKNDAVWPAWKYFLRFGKKLNFKSYEDPYWSLFEECVNPADEEYAVNNHLKLNGKTMADIIQQAMEFYKKGIVAILRYNGNLQA